MSLIIDFLGPLFSAIFVVAGIGVITWCLVVFLDYRNSIVGAFLPSAMSKLKLIVGAIGVIIALVFVWNIVSVMKENKRLAADNAVQKVSIKSSEVKDEVNAVVDQVNQEKTTEVIVVERKIDASHKSITGKSQQRERVIETTLNGKAKQEALSAERIGALWELYETAQGGNRA